jgi:hypothetical protein
MKLIHRTSGFVVAEYREDQTIIHDRMLAQEMSVGGVAIPPPLKGQFNGKKNVLLGEKEFQRAFKQLYFPQVFNLKNYFWEE